VIYIGIDPGVSGAVAALDGAGRVISLQDTPTLEEKVGKHIRNTYAEPGMAALVEGIVRSSVEVICHSCGAIERELTSAHVLVAIENVHSMPKQGVASSFSFGVGYGVWRGIIAMLGLPSMRVEPVVWKKALGLPKAKGASVAKALKLFPRAELGHLYRGRMIYSDGRAEALLLAHYAASLAVLKRKGKSAVSR
jgi:crossover junction endodeoxyribonuclease RuvC